MTGRKHRVATPKLFERGGCATDEFMQCRVVQHRRHFFGMVDPKRFENQPATLQQRRLWPADGLRHRGGVRRIVIRVTAFPIIHKEQ